MVGVTVASSLSYYLPGMFPHALGTYLIVPFIVRILPKLP